MNNKQLYEKQSNQYKPFFPIVKLEDIIDKISDKSIQWILNNYNHIYVEYSESVAITRNKVPSLLRRNGLWISYNNGKETITEYYIGSNNDVLNYNIWTDDVNWERFDKIKHFDSSITYQHLSETLKQLIGNNNKITNFPDEEDITTDGTVLSFKDRNYEPNNFSGLGRLILRKNIKAVDGQPKNVLTQNMINKANTCYEIRYDFDLGDAKITIPEGCILNFQGGSLSNGTIVGTIKVYAANSKIFDNVNFKNGIQNDVNSAWFGSNPKSEDNSASINKAIAAATKNVILCDNNILQIEDTIVIDKADISIQINGTIKAVKNIPVCLFISTNKNRLGCTLENGLIDGNGLAEKGIELYSGNRHIINNVNVKGFTNTGIYAHRKRDSVETRVDVTNSIIDNSNDLLNCVGIYTDIYDSTFNNIEIRNCNIGVDAVGGHNVFTNIHGWTIIDDIYKNSTLIRTSSYQDNVYISCTCDTMQHLVHITRDWVIANFIGPLFYINIIGSITEELLNSFPPLVVKKDSYNALVNINNLAFMNDKNYSIVDNNYCNARDRVSCVTYPIRGTTNVLKKYYNEKSHFGNVLFDESLKKWVIFNGLSFDGISHTQSFASVNSKKSLIKLAQLNNWERYNGYCSISIDGLFYATIEISAYNNNNNIVTKCLVNNDLFDNFNSYFYIINKGNSLYFYVVRDCVVLINSSQTANEVSLEGFDISEYNIIELIDRPTIYRAGNNPVIGNSNISIAKGSTFFSTSLNKPLWWTGTKWVDATGAEI